MEIFNVYPSEKILISLIYVLKNDMNLTKKEVFLAFDRHFLQIMIEKFETKGYILVIQIHRYI